MVDELNHPIERVTFDRWRGVNVMADARELAVAVSGRCVRIHIGRAYKNFEKVRRCDVVMLSVAKELTEILFEKPIEIANPVQSFRMHNRPESWIGKKRATGGSGLFIAAVDRDDDFEIAKRLLLQALQSFADEIGAFVNWHSHSNSRCRQLGSPSVQLAGGTNPLRTNFCEVRRHGELSWIDGMETSFGSDANLEPPMQFA